MTLNRGFVVYSIDQVTGFIYYFLNSYLFIKYNNIKSFQCNYRKAGTELNLLKNNIIKGIPRLSLQYKL